MARTTRLDRVTVEVAGVPFCVYFECWPEYRGARDTLGEPLEPDEPADFEIVSVFIEGHEMTDLLTEEVLLIISKAVLEVER